MSKLLSFLLYLCLARPIVALPHNRDNSKRDVPYFTGVSPPTTNPDILRGVNIGGWLILEKWMTPDLFSGPFAEASDQWAFDSTSGAAEALQNHWSTYFTEADVWTIKSYGFNALRIPIGYWAFDNANTPYLSGASDYLDRAISWARSAGLKVWVDCHGSPGSQNGYDNSGHAGEVLWQEPSKLNLSISVLETMAQKYGSASYSDVVIALEIVNEPISYSPNNIATTRQFALDAYAAVKTAAANPALTVIMHDAFQPLSTWSDLASSLSPHLGAFALDTHHYQLFAPTPSTFTQPDHISLACTQRSALASTAPSFPTYIGEWTALSNICVNPDGTTSAGTTCDVPGCQCQSAPLEQWNEMLVLQTRRFVEAQMESFEQGGAIGWVLWSWEGPGGWGVRRLVEKGVVPQPLEDRWFGGGCS